MTNVKVSHEHISNGEQKKCDKCPIALALNSILKPNLHVLVAVATILVDDVDGRTLACLSLPGTAARFALAFDKGLLVEQFSFDMEIPQNLLK